MEAVENRVAEIETEVDTAMESATVAEGRLTE